MKMFSRGGVRLAAVAIAGVALLAACSDSGSTASSSTAASSAAAPASSAAAESPMASAEAAASAGTDQGAVEPASDAVATLPEELWPAYVGLDQPIGKTDLETFIASKPAPWTIGYASSYAGNTWRKEAMDRLMKDLLPKYQEAGLVKDVIVTQSDLDDATQIQQIRQLADQGVDAIIVCCSSITALNEAISYAWDKGIPTFSWSGYLTSPYSLNVSANYKQAGRDAASWMAEKIGGQGTVLNVVGIPGAASSDTYDAGVQEALAEYPDIKVVGNIAGMWTDPVAKTEVLKFLATNPGQIDGIITQSAQETGVLQAFLEAGQDVPPMTLGGEGGAACYWLQNPDWVDQGFHVWPPGDEMQFAFEAAIRTLQGQGPKVASLIRGTAPLTLDQVKAALPEGDKCDVNNQVWIQPGPENWMPSSTLDQYFTNGYDPLTGSAS